MTVYCKCNFVFSGGIAQPHTSWFSPGQHGSDVLKALGVRSERRPCGFPDDNLTARALWSRAQQSCTGFQLILPVPFVSDWT